MPELLVESISEPREYQFLQNKKTPAAELARILHLAELLAELVAQNRLGVLPDLLEAGKAYCGLEKEQLHRLAASLQPKVRQLADVLSLDLREGADYSAIVAEAHQQMSEIAETVAEPLSRLGDTTEETCENLLADVVNLRTAAENFLGNPAPQTASLDEMVPVDAALVPMKPNFLNKLTLAVGQCRSLRQPLSILLLEVNAEPNDAYHEQVISQVLETVSRDSAAEGVLVEVVSPNRRALVLAGNDRQEAIRHAKAIFRTLEEVFQELATTGIPGEFSASAGIATVSLPVKNFPPIDLIETAQRCLAAARSTDASAVKSLEIF